MNIIKKIKQLQAFHNLKKIKIGNRSSVCHEKISFKNDCRMIIGDDCQFNSTVIFDREDKQIIVGDRCFIGPSTFIIGEGIIIGNDVLISWGCTFADHDSHSLCWDHRKNDVIQWLEGKKNWEHISSGNIIIGDRAWVGFDAVVLKGVTIGEGSVVAAGSVVTKNVPPYTLVAGNPAQIIKSIK